MQNKKYKYYSWLRGPSDENDVALFVSPQMKMESGKGAKWQDRRFHLQEGLRPHDLAESVPRLLKDGFGHALRAGRDAAGNSLLHWAVEGVSAQFMNFFGSDAIYIWYIKGW